MYKNNKLPFRFYLTLSILAGTLTVTPANALPEQNINTVIKWAKTKPLLPTLTYNSEAYGYGGTKGNLYFYASVTSENGEVTKEGITISGNPNVKFTTKNPQAMKLLQNIYDVKIANDFRNAPYITKVGRDQFYRGKIFAYITAAVQNGTNFEIIPLKNLQEAINNAKFCQTHECDL